MKKICVILLVLVMGISLTMNAQAPYKHSVGATLISINGVSYKTFLTDKLALSIDGGFKWTVSPVMGYAAVPLTGEVNPNLMYEAGAGPQGLYWFAGGGISLGGWTGAGKFGFNAIGGVEYKFSDVPLTLQGDFRPGFGLAFNSFAASGYFDWGLCFGIRYTIN